MERLVGVRSNPKFGFLVAAVTTCKVNFEKSYMTQFLLELSRSYAQIENLDI